jgi:hypothetical protein
MCVSASTMRVRVEFSMVNFVFPCLPEMRPMVRDRCSPRNVCACPDRACQRTKSTARGEGWCIGTRTSHVMAMMRWSRHTVMRGVGRRAHTLTSFISNDSR